MRRLMKPPETRDLQMSSLMAKTGSLNDCKICAKEVIQSTARKTGIDEGTACKSHDSFETGSSRYKTILPTRFIGKEEAEKSLAMVMTKRIPAGLRKTIGSRSQEQGNCKEVFGNKNENTATDSENFARLLVLFLETDIVGNQIAKSGERRY